jgi:branched-chain amino acid transport system ATP-binding protein
MLLELRDVSVHYGRIRALHGVDLQVDEGEVVALIGANGAGKTTIMRAVSGLQPVSTGSVLFEGQDITRLRADRRVARGISLSPEGRGVFPGMSVKENLGMGAYTRRDRAGIAADLERMLTLFPRLRERLGQPGGTLSGGEQQMLAVARSLMSRPKVLLLDEPSMGLAPKLIAQIFDIVVEIRRRGTTILLVEQNAHQALRIADRGYVLETGSVVRTGSGEGLLDDSSIKAAYLGVA